MRVPAWASQHPIESLFAVALLLGLLFASADSTAPVAAPSHSLMAKS